MAEFCMQTYGIASLQFHLVMQSILVCSPLVGALPILPRGRECEMGGHLPSARHRILPDDACHQPIISGICKSCSICYAGVVDSSFAFSAYVRGFLSDRQCLVECGGLDVSLQFSSPVNTGTAECLQCQQGISSWHAKNFSILCVFMAHLVLEESQVETVLLIQ